MAATTVLLADLPTMLEDMVTSVLEEQPDIKVIRGPAGGAGPIEAAVAAGAPVVIVARCDPADLAAIDPHLANATSASVIALSPDGSSACLHSFNVVRECFDDVSAQHILRAIAAAAPARRS